MNYIKNLIKKISPSFFEKIRSNKFMYNMVIFWHWYVWFILKNSPKHLPIFLWNNLIHNLWFKKDVNISFQWNNFIMPNHMRWLDAIIEVFADEFYDKLKWYNNVLDLGGYIWESAIRLSKNNKNIVVYEAHPENYEYLAKNIKNKANITSYNKAVVWDDTKEVIFYGWWFNMWAWIENINNSKSSVIVECENIIDILLNWNFDAIKMDIEWWEYWCMESLMKRKDLFYKLKSWFIEFHIYNSENKINSTNKIIKRLSDIWYEIEIYDVINEKNITISQIIKSEVILVYFIMKQ